MPSTAISAQGSTVSIGTTTGSAINITAVALTNPCQEFRAAAAQRQYRDLYRLCEEIQQPRGGGSGDPAHG
jgi:hypothetical protein